MNKYRVWIGLVAVAAMPVLMGQRGGGCGGDMEMVDASEVPDMSGTWNLTFNNDLSVEVDIGGTVYNPTLAGGSDQVTVTHDGQPISYTINCDSPFVSCPSELLPSSVRITQSGTNPRSVSLEIEEQECRGGEVVEGQCSGTLITSTSTRNGSISMDNGSFSIILGGGAVANDNCALLSISVASGDLVTSGSAATGDLLAEEIMNGELITAYAGGCLVAGSTDLDPNVESAAVGATVQLRSTYTALRAP